MPVNIIKLSVGTESPEGLKAWQDHVMDRSRKATGKADLYHRTRMHPKREDELKDGGSVYWVIKGIILVRQKILDLRQMTDDEGIKRCDIILHPKLISVRPTPRRPFQGWRYLTTEDAPPDLGAKDREMAKMPPEMRNELTDLGLL